MKSLAAPTAIRPRVFAVIAMLAAWPVAAIVTGPVVGGEEPQPPAMQRVRVSDDGKKFALAGSGKPFVPWGFNYLGQFERLAEDDWDTPDGWRRIETDFREMRRLGANVVRWHLQFE